MSTEASFNDDINKENFNINNVCQHLYEINGI